MLVWSGWGQYGSEPVAQRWPGRESERGMRPSYIVGVVNAQV
jgi:hypothetical protein